MTSSSPWHRVCCWTAEKDGRPDRLVLLIFFALFRCARVLRELPLRPFKEERFEKEEEQIRTTSVTFSRHSPCLERGQINTCCLQQIAGWKFPKHQVAKLVFLLLFRFQLAERRLCVCLLKLYEAILSMCDYILARPVITFRTLEPQSTILKYSWSTSHFTPFSAPSLISEFGLQNSFCPMKTFSWSLFSWYLYHSAIIS